MNRDRSRGPLGQTLWMARLLVLVLAAFALGACSSGSAVGSADSSADEVSPPITEAEMGRAVGQSVDVHTFVAHATTRGSVVFIASGSVASACHEVQFSIDEPDEAGVMNAGAEAWLDEDCDSDVEAPFMVSLQISGLAPGSYIAVLDGGFEAQFEIEAALDPDPILAGVPDGIVGEWRLDDGVEAVTGLPEGVEVLLRVRDLGRQAGPLHVEISFGCGDAGGGTSQTDPLLVTDITIEGVGCAAALSERQLPVAELILVALPTASVDGDVLSIETVQGPVVFSTIKPRQPESPPATTPSNPDSGDQGWAEIGSEWTPLREGPADGRVSPVSVWTGTELIIWGGETQSETTWANNGAAYVPESGQWRAMADSPLSQRSGHVAVWTGEEMIVCCGQNQSGDASGFAAYDPVADSWRELTPPPFEAALAAAVWTGTEMIVTGGSNFNGTAAYDPAVDSWSLLASAPRKIERQSDVAWAGEQLIVWPRAFTNAPGLIYDRGDNEWRQLPELPAELAVSQGSMVWTGTDIIVWGAINSNESATVGARITLNGDQWQPLAENPLGPFERWNGTDGASSAVWTGTEMLIWVGSIDNVSDPDDLTTSTLAYNPLTDAWRRFNDASTTWHHPQMLWTGEVSIVLASSTLVIDPGR